MAGLHSNRGAKRAREARKALGFTREGPVPDLLAAVEEAGGAHVVVLDLPDGLAGAHIARPGCPLLFLNGRQPVSRQRFTLAHEFGHFRMGHGTVVDREAAISGWDRDPNEVCANAFAAEFLMPRDAIAAWGRRQVDGPVTLEHVIALAYEYGVSSQAARYALETAGVLGDSQRCAQLDGEIRDELHFGLGRELGLTPLEDGLTEIGPHLPRVPPALRGSLFADLLAGDADVVTLAQRLGRDERDVRAMVDDLGLAAILPSLAEHEVDVDRS